MQRWSVETGLPKSVYFWALWSWKVASKWNSLDFFSCLFIQILYCNAVHLEQEKEDIKYGFWAFNSSVLTFIWCRFLMSFQGTACLLLTVSVTKPELVLIFILKYLTSSYANSLIVSTCAYLIQADYLPAF